MKHLATVISLAVPILAWPTQNVLRPPSSLPESWNLTSPSNTTFHNVYHPLFEVDSFLRELATSVGSDIARLVELGHSAEGREMYALTLSKSKSSKSLYAAKPKQGFLIIGAQHAREWIATATSLYFAHALVTPSSESESLSDLLDEFDFHIIPAPNPDGYAYTWESDRLWYKNRMVVGVGEPCTGLDMNRNWGYEWSPDSLTSDVCSHWYPGRRPFEAPEVNNIANFVSRTPNLLAFLDLRSYGQMLSTPFSFSCEALPNAAEDIIEAAQGAVKALTKVHGTSMKTGSLCENLYPAPGNIVDWMYAEAGIKYSYAAHLRDTGTYGFTLPPEQIIPVGEETAAMVEYIANFISKHGY